MSEDNVVNMPGRGALNSPTFQTALKLWRKFAHRRSLVVGSPVRLIGAERTIFGDSDDMVEGAKSYVLNKTGIGIDLGGLWVSKNDKEMLEQLVEDLDARSDFDIKDVRAPSTEQVPDHDDERDRWDLWVSTTQRVGTVVRIGEGAKKHYLLYLWHGGWYRVTGSPCYDLPLFGLPDLRARPEAPVMIHEGPKAWSGATKPWEGRLANWMSLYVHVAWHGSDVGMEWTDWSPLRGRRVLIWPDMDEPGLINARNLAARLALMGNVVEYVNWSRGDIETSESWDWADPPTPLIRSLTRTSIRKRLLKVESPIGPDGKILGEWSKRSFLDLSRREVYMVSRDYTPLPLDSLALGKPKNFKSDLIESAINPFYGTDFLPGIPYGRLADGKINLCPPNIREPVVPVPLSKDTYRVIRDGWLSKMIPDVRQRKHLIRRACWAIARPEYPSQHMIVLQGESGIGKSVMLDLIVRVAGEDRAASLFPDSIMTRFNSLIARKSVVCIHEIHSDDLTRKQNASRLKELIANDAIAIEEKMRPTIMQKNIIHWFAATNERAPFSLEHGNDRFYFIKCVSPPTRKKQESMRRFFRSWVPKFKKDEFCDRLYAAAKYQVTTFTKKTINDLVGRARRQSIWTYLEKSSMRPWEQSLFLDLQKIMEQEDPGEGEDHPPLFFGGDLVRLITRNFPRVGPLDVMAKMNEFGYCRVVDGVKGYPVRVRLPNGQKEVVWCRMKDLRKVQVWKGNRAAWRVRNVQ